ncbi:hypothetical protein [Nocardiopsis sp. YSL2]|uniref:hypothetical protein n=1 Tax=Nocardiopsis sp. YSL2 TaxID=2939492 RepID=UPI0026F45E5A|nr:hypothetical protein [Nocardiopsis sp. YSL2]
MDTLSGSAAPDRLPERVRDDLMDVDRLRAIWAQHRQGQSRDARGAARRASVRSRVRQMGGGPALEALLESASGDRMSGRPVTAEVVEELNHDAASLPEDCASRSPRRTLGADRARRLAEAAALPAHPVVRAAHTYAECVAVLSELDESHTPRDRSPWVLPWVLASLVLRRADFPPLLPDPASEPARPDDAFATLVSRFARLVTGALRDELSWTPDAVPQPRSAIPPLAAVLRRRLQDYLHTRAESVALILRSMDPEARASVHSGGADAPTADAVGAAAAAPTVLTPGAAHWWTVLELVVGDASLTLAVVVQEIGHPRTGVLAVTANARLATADGVRDALDMTGEDSVTVIPTDCADDRWPQVRDLVDEALSRSMQALTRV